MEDGSRRYREIDCNTKLGHVLAAVAQEMKSPYMMKFIRHSGSTTQYNTMQSNVKKQKRRKRKKYNVNGDTKRVTRPKPQRSKGDRMKCQCAD